MSNEEETIAKEEKRGSKITTEIKPPKPKDPKRVEAGKRLAELSRLARERKKREAEEANNNLLPNEDKVFTRYLPVFGVVSVFVGSYLFYKFSSKKEETLVEPKKKTTKKQVKVTSMDDSD